MAIEFSVDHDHTYASEVGFEQLIGWITFSVGTAPGDFRYRDPSAGLAQSIKLPPRRGWLAADGHLYKDQTLAEPCRLVANDPLFNLQHLTYRADFALTTLAGDPVPVPHTYFPAPSSDTLLQLTKVMTDPYQPVMEVRAKVYTEDILDAGEFGTDLLFTGTTEDFWELAGTVPSTNLPSYVDDVLEFTNAAAFPVTGETGKIYVDRATGDAYRWTGSQYLRISDRVSAAGITDSTEVGRAVVTGTAAAGRSALDVFSKAQTASPADQLPNECGFWWVSEPVAIDGKIYMGTCGAERGSWIQEWTQPAEGGPYWLHRYFMGFSEITTFGAADLRDDHVPAQFAVKPGKPLVAFWSPHGVNNRFYYRISNENVDEARPGELTFGPIQTVEAAVGDERTSYTQVMYHGDDIWVGHRTGYTVNKWTLTKFPNWGTGTPVSYDLWSTATSGGQINQLYTKFRMTDGGVIRCMVANGPLMSVHRKVWWAEINTTTGDITKADGTVLGNLDGTNLPLAANVALETVFTSPTDDGPFLFDVGYGSAREMTFVNGKISGGSLFSNATYKHARWNGTSWVVSDISPVATGPNNQVTYFFNVQFVPGESNAVVLNRAEPSGTDTGTHYVEKWTTANNGATWTKASVIDSAPYDMTGNGPRLALSRVFPVRVASGAKPFDVIGADVRKFPNFYSGWEIYTRPLPLSHPVRAVPADSPIDRGLDTEPQSPATGLYLPGTTGHYIKGPTSSVPSEGLRMELDVALPDWTPGAELTLLSKEKDNDTREPRLVLSAVGRIGIYWSEDGSTFQNLTPNDVPSPPFAPWQRVKLAFEFIPSHEHPTIAGSFQKSIRSMYRFRDDEAWTTLNVSQLPTATSIFAGDSPWEIGGRQAATQAQARGIYYRAAIMTLGGETLAEWRADRSSDQGVQVDPQGNTWTIESRGMSINSPTLLLPRADLFLDPATNIATLQLATTASPNNANPARIYISSSDASAAINAVGSPANIPIVVVPKNDAFRVFSATTPTIQGWSVSGTANLALQTQAVAGAVEIINSVGDPGVLITGSIQLGHATDTTITRSAAGLLAVEGVDLATLVDTPLDLTAGENTLRRREISSTALALSNGQLRLTYFTARRTETVTSVRTIVNGAAVGTTLARIGIYEVNPSTGDLTLVASTANDTALWSGTGVNTKALSASFTKTRGTRYAVGLLVVGTSTAPQLSGAAVISGTEAAESPRQSGVLLSQTDITTPIANASLSASGSQFYAALVP